MGIDWMPSFGSWLRTSRETQGWTVSELAARVHAPRGTVATFETRTRQGSQPRPGLVHQIAAVFGEPVLGVALVAGYFDQHVLGPDEVLDCVIEGHGRSTVGAQYVHHVRTAANRDLAVGLARWTQHWDPDSSISDDEWARLEDHGQLPASWQQILRVDQLAHLPGVWMWSLLEAVGGTLRDVVGMAFAMGRIRPSLIAKAPWHAAPDAEQLTTALRNAYAGSQTFDVDTYHHTLQTVPWTVPVLRDSHPIPAHAKQADENLSAVIWHHLNRQYPGIALVATDDLLAQVVRQWADLSEEQQAAIVQLVQNPAFQRVRDSAPYV